MFDYIDKLWVKTGNPEIKEIRKVA